MMVKKKLKKFNKGKHDKVAIVLAVCMAVFTIVYTVLLYIPKGD